MTTSTKELLVELNARRIASGKTELKAWKESRAKLEAAIEALPPVLPAEPTEGEVKGNGAAKRRSSDIVQWCRENGVNPKVARNKLRRAKMRAPYVIDDKAVAILLGDARKGK